MGFFQQSERLNIATGVATFTLKNNVALDNLTIWVVGQQPTTDITVQPQINGVNFGSSTTVTNAAGKARSIVFVANNATDGRRIIPANKGPAQQPLSPQTAPSPFVFTLNITSATDEPIDVYAVGEELS